MQAYKMKCIFCKGNLSKELVTEEVKVGNDHVLVKLEAEVCENCHEKYFPEGTVDFLQEIKKKLKADKSHLKPIGQVYQSV